MRIFLILRSIFETKVAVERVERHGAADDCAVIAHFEKGSA